MSHVLSTEDLIDTAYSSLKDDFDPALLTTIRAPLVQNYASKEHVEAMLRQILLRILLDRPEHPVPYMIDLIKEYRPRTAVVIGPPASGKRTLAEGIANRLGLEHVCVADLVEGMKMTQTDLGMRMREYEEQGLDVPDELVETLVTTRLRERDCTGKGWVMDGWPRTAQQARNLRALGLDPQAVLVMEVPDQVVEDRVSFRVLDPETNTLYHTYANPPPLGVGIRCVTRRGESSDEIIERVARHKELLPGVLDALGVNNPPKGFQMIRVQGDVPYGDLDGLSDSLAKKIAV
uniref:Adenylate kinase n=1 Tax=Hemiselmis andersenii TaxID=464988 RepID=A0A6U5B5B9_HEMAN|mmetsp:Transcript_11682/g.27097  ORF Transcript_11682/g.27097 Transcript_11682/m.27097 type:complete len:291 (+) Transcript_11682:57-929(+)